MTMEWFGLVGIACSLIALFTHISGFAIAAVVFVFIYAVYVTVKIRRDGDQ
jgi:hypothetical protein